MITGDVFHHPLQFGRPHWVVVADTHSEVAERSRRQFMEEYGEPVLVLGTHFALPTAGVIVRDGQHYRFDVRTPQ